MDWDKITADLTKKLNPDHVKGRKQGGGTVSYIEGWHAIAEANRIFGFGEWTRETLELRQLGDPREVDGKNRVEYMARVRITVAGVVRDGCGFGQGIDRDVGQAHESALKEAETDAMKRAFMTFGNPFGLALYDKSRENVGVDYDPRPAATLIKEALGNAGVMAKLGAVWTGQKDELKRIKDAAPDLFEELEAFKEFRKSQLDPARQAPQEAAE